MHKFLFTFLSVFVIGFMPGIATGLECTHDDGTCNRGCRWGALGECERCPANTYQTKDHHKEIECTPCKYPDGTTKVDADGSSNSQWACKWTITCDNHKYFDMNDRECKQCDPGDTGREESFTYHGDGIEAEGRFSIHEQALAAYSKENYCVKDINKYPLLLRKNTPLDKLGPNTVPKGLTLYPSDTTYPIEYKDLEICVTIVKDDTDNEQPYVCPNKCSDCPDDIDPVNGPWVHSSQFSGNYGGFPDKTLSYFLAGYSPDNTNAPNSPYIAGGDNMANNAVYRFENFTTENMKNIYDEVAEKYVLDGDYIRRGNYPHNDPNDTGLFIIYYRCTPTSNSGIDSGWIDLSICVADETCVTTDDTDGKRTVKIIVKDIGEVCTASDAPEIGCDPGQYINGVYKCTDDDGNACYNTDGETEIEPGDDISIPVNNAQVSRTITPSCEPCKIGYYCPGGYSDPIPCPAGTSSAAGSSAVSNCYMNPQYNDTGTKFTDSVGSFYLPSAGPIRHYDPNGQN